MDVLQTLKEADEKYYNLNICLKHANIFVSFFFFYSNIYISLTPSQPNDMSEIIDVCILAINGWPGLSGPLQCLMGGIYGGINIRGIIPQRK